MIKSILLPIDGSSYSEAVISYGKFFAEKFNAIIRVLSIVDIRLFDWSVATNADNFVPVMPPAGFQAETQKMHDEKAQQILDKAANLLKSTGIPFELTKVTGIPVEEICNQAKQNDLVVMGIRGEYERWSDKLLGATIESVSRQISKPIILVEKSFFPFEKILCGYDGSIYANKGLQYAAFMAQILSIPIQVIAVFSSDEERKAVLAEAEQYLTPYKIDFQLRHETGDASEILVNATKTTPNPALLIIGSYGHSRLREAVLGSTTVQVMRAADKPIMLAK
ncbi:MAG: universal stress protein [Calditrichaceae bacterium]